MTESHYAGLIQSLQIEYSDQFARLLNNTLNRRTLYVRHSQGNYGYSMANGEDEEASASARRKKGVIDEYPGQDSNLWPTD